MPCTIVVGGQYGSEGKGKVVALQAGALDSPWVVRCGGPNSGHTVTIGGREKVLRQVPAGARHPQATLLLAAGCVVDEAVLLRELADLQIPPERMIVDPRAVLVEEADRQQEQGLVATIGSTSSGTGLALARRMARSGHVRFIGDSKTLRDRIRVETVAPLIHSQLAADGDVIVEGTQGFGLSLLHAPDYPFVTSRDTTAAGFAMEVGLSPRQIDFVVMVIRTFPIRVGGHSGPLAREITWERVREIGKAPFATEEYTSVTGRLRRVGVFDIELVKTACRYNQPTSLAIMGLDRLDYNNCNVTESSRLSSKACAFVEFVEAETGVQVELGGTGFATDQATIIKPRVGVSHV